MIRRKLNIDTKLVNYFISEKEFSNEINESLIDWYGSLGNKDHQQTRNNAIIFLKKFAFEVLGEINYPGDERKDIIEIFEPLELLLRTAFSLKDFGEENSESIRDHLSHTVRDILFANYLSNKYNPENITNKKRLLFIAAIFHDTAYPIEKLKKVAKKLGDAAFKRLLNSTGKIEIALNNPDDLLDVLDYFGTFLSKLDHKIELLLEQKNLAQNEEKNKKIFKRLENEINEKELIKRKVTHIYVEIVCKAIAGKGLFDASHAISSVVLFLRPIIKHWRNSETYQDLNFQKIADVCLAMSYHDRKKDPKLLPFQIPDILKIMRITDELQEWDRESYSFIDDVRLCNDVSAVVSVEYKMKNRSVEEQCKGEITITDKILGILPLVNEEMIKLSFTFPNDCLKSRIITHLKNHDILNSNFSFIGKLKGKSIKLIFKNSNVEVQID